MASVVGKQINGRTYYYLVESSRINGRPRIVSQQYLGTAESIQTAVRDHRPIQAGVERVRQLPFGDVAAVYGVLTDLRLPRIVDDVVGRTGGVSVGNYLALAVLCQAVAPSAQLDLGGWWTHARPDRFVRPRVARSALDGRRSWQAMDRLSERRIQEVEAALAPNVLRMLGAPTSPLLLDVTDFATYAVEQPRGLGLVVTREGAVPLAGIPYDPAALSGPALVERLDARLQSLLGGQVAEGGTLILDAAQANGRVLEDRGFVAALRPADHPDLVSARIGGRPVDPQRFPGVTAREFRSRVDGRDRRVVLLHSTVAHAAQSRALTRDLAHVTRRLTELAAAAGRPGSRLTLAEVRAELSRITQFRWGELLVSGRLEERPRGGIRLRWSLDSAARARLDRELLGRQLLVTSHQDWPLEEVLTAYRARYWLESTLRQSALIQPPLPSHRWTDRRIAVHSFVCRLAATVTHLMRHQVQRAGLDLSVRELLERLSEIRETQIRTPTDGRPRTRRILTELDADHRMLFELFRLDRFAPRR